MACQKQWIAEDFEPGLVSVIIPTYNRQQFLGEAIQSVIGQTYKNWECIIVDDGSTDNTRVLVQTVVEKHGADRIRYFHQSNHGAPAARNRGTIESRGEFIQYLDSDDWLGPERLAKCIQRYTDEEANLLYGPMIRVTAARFRRLVSKGWGNGKVPGGDLLAAELQGWHLQTSCPLYRRKTLSAAGPWDENFRTAAQDDIDYALRVAMYVGSATFEPGGLAFYRRHTGHQMTKEAGGLLAVRPREMMASKIDTLLQESGLLDRYKSDLAWFYFTNLVFVYRATGRLHEPWLDRMYGLGPPQPRAYKKFYYPIARVLGWRNAARFIAYFATPKKWPLFHR